VCASCHGFDGDLLTDRRLSNLASRLDRDAAIRIIKSPRAPMPQMFPDLLTEQNVQDVTAYMYQELRR
jgi:mono/diheme cytochrome c family protein